MRVARHVVQARGEKTGSRLLFENVKLIQWVPKQGKITVNTRHRDDVINFPFKEASVNMNVITDCGEEDIATTDSITKFIAFPFKV